jgi:hypothetical protein
MNTHDIVQLTDNAIAVTFPEGSWNYDLYQQGDQIELGYLHSFNKGKVKKGFIQLPLGNWSILGLSTQLSEEDWEKVVREKFWIGGFGWMYTNYTDEVTLANEIWKRTGPFKTAAESGATLLASKGITSPVLILIKK